MVYYALCRYGAVPGIWPLVSIGDRFWTDGGMVSTTNARLAEGYERIVILSPMPSGYGSIPGAAEDAEILRTSADVYLITPDERSVVNIGPNPYDPARRSVTAIAGREQGRSIAEAVRCRWMVGCIVEVDLKSNTSKDILVVQFRNGNIVPMAKAK